MEVMGSEFSTCVSGVRGQGSGGMILIGALSGDRGRYRKVRFEEG